MFINNSGEFIENTIYVCFAEDVLEYLESIGFETEDAAALYYPLLRRKNIMDVDTLLKSRNSLINETKNL